MTRDKVEQKVSIVMASLDTQIEELKVCAENSNSKIEIVTLIEAAIQNVKDAINNLDQINF